VKSKGAGGVILQQKLQHEQQWGAFRDSFEAAGAVKDIAQETIW
jgi:hypothetical protein